MTVQEAINNIDDVLSSDVNYDESIDYQLTSDDIDWLEKSKEALEKQIPKKATEKTTNRGIDISGEYDIDFDLCCPICGAVVGTFEESENEYFVRHCDNCGQKLLWESDTE